MKSETLFNRIAGSGVLLSAGAIIPSYSALRHQLVSQLTQLQRLLQEERCPPQESSTLCHLLGGYLDIYLQKYRLQQGILVADTPLATSLQETDTLQVPTALAAQLEMLVECANPMLFDYSYTLINLLSLPDINQNAEIALLLARYQQRKLASMTLSAAPHRQDQRALAENKPVCLIVGPCAGNWFSQYDTTRNKQGILWLIAPDPQQFIQRYRILTEQYPTQPLCCLIPLLGDMYQNNDLLAAEFQRWTQIVSSVSGIAALPCELVVYSPLSQQRQRHDPDAAFWVKTPAKSSDTCSVTTQLDALYQCLQDDDSRGELYAVQRRLSAAILLEWLRTSPLLQALQTLFTKTPLTLSGIMLADYGHGFTRHGAWSAWLSEHYLLCPSLADCLTPPPLPELTFRSAPARSQPLPVTPPAVMDSRRRHRQAVLIPLVVIGGIYSGIALMAPSSPPSEISPSRSAISPGRYLTRDDFAAWFAPGSSVLLAERYQTLAAVIPKLQQYARYPVLIVGYSDNTGNKDSNRLLSLQRAQVVRDWLVSNAQLPESHFILDGAGVSRPLISDGSPAALAGNRRIEIISLSPQTFQVNKSYD